MSKKRLKAAIVGCGNISSTHGDAIKNCTEAELFAVCDVDLERVSAFSQKYGCLEYADYSLLLQNKEIDVVHLCTPHYLHAPMAIDALRAGKHVLVEKPMAIMTSDAEKMILVSEQTGKNLSVCLQNRYNRTTRKIEAVLASGKPGKVLGGRAFVTWFRDEGYYRSGSWRGSWEQEGGGVLINQAVHTLDLLQHFIGEVASLKASCDTRLLEGVIEVEDTLEATLRFKNGAKGFFYATNNYPANSPVFLELVCENATIMLNGDVTITYKNGERQTFSESGTEEDEIEEDPNQSNKPGHVNTVKKDYWGYSHTLLIQDFYKNVLAGTPHATDGHAGLTSIKTVNAIYHSCKTKEWV